jgi:hypothetical protein
LTSLLSALFLLFDICIVIVIRIYIDFLSFSYLALFTLFTCCCFLQYARYPEFTFSVPGYLPPVFTYCALSAHAARSHSGVSCAPLLRGPLLQCAS